MVSNKTMKSTKELIYEKKEGVATLTFNRPEKLNAFTPEMICRIVDAWDDIAQDNDVRVVVVTGAGERSFNVGGDLEILTPILNRSREPANEWETRVANDDLLPKLVMRHFPHYKPVICAINGLCLGGGFEFVNHTDIRVASETAKFGMPEVKLGILPGTSMTTLTRQIHYTKAMELLLTGDTINAHEALRWGIVNHVVPSDQVLDKAMEIAHKIAANAPIAVVKCKETALSTVGLPIKEAYEKEWLTATEVLATEDAKEGARAFVEKRQPKYQGK